MFFHIDYSSGEPISHQMVAQIKWMVVSGELQTGDRLPSIRQLAKQLKINPTTVTRIYKELEHAGIINLRQGQGAFVCQIKSLLPRKEIHKIVREKARAMLVEGLRLGLDKQVIDKIVNHEFSELREPKNE